MSIFSRYLDSGGFKKWCISSSCRFPRTPSVYNNPSFMESAGQSDISLSWYTWTYGMSEYRLCPTCYLGLVRAVPSPSLLKSQVEPSLLVIPLGA